MFSTASASAIFTTLTGQLGVVILSVLGVIVTAWGGFLALRWALRKVRGVIR